MLKKVIFISICMLLLVGCDTDFSYDPESLTPIFVDIPSLKISGGNCAQGAIAMAIAYLEGHKPNKSMVESQNEWLKYDGNRGVHMNEIMSLLWEFWGYEESRYRQYRLPELHERLSSGEVLILIIEGWRGRWHTVVLTGIDGPEQLVCVNCPVLGALSYTMEEFEKYHAYTRYGVIVVRK